MIRERTGELVLAKEKAEAPGRAKSVFLANMSHELRTPLASILGVCELLERDSDFPQKHDKLLTILSGSGKHLFDLIDDVLELSKIDSWQPTVSIETLDLHAFLKDLVGSLNSMAEKKGLEMVLELDRALPRYIRTDGPKLRHILANLLSNAIKFTEKGRVILRSKRQGSDEAVRSPEDAFPLRLAFEDTGIGIPPEDLEIIFDKFVQVVPSRRPSGGVELGLAISKTLAELLGEKLPCAAKSAGGASSL
jgi:signal transduction histidine kinase